MSDRDQQSRPKGRIRDQIHAFAIAILMAVLMKWFAIEAYQIPTSSMQPTMMGSSTAGLYDRILVDKSYYLFHEPRRWDLAVFRYPIRRQQSYVKRIVGMPDDRLRISGGNLYQVTGEDIDDPANLQPLPRPAAVQASHWKEVFPARLAVHGHTKSLDGALRKLNGNWIEHGLDSFSVQDESRAILLYIDDGAGGLVNQVYDGYPTWVAQTMVRNEPPTADLQVVQDARVRMALTCSTAPDEFDLRLRLQITEARRFDFGLTIAAGNAVLFAERDGTRVAASEPLPVQLAGNTIDLEFQHLDDTCAMTIDGETRQIDCGSLKTLTPLRPDIGSNRSRDSDVATVRIELRGGSKVRIDDLGIDRDVHYEPAQEYRDTADEVIAIPSGHYFLMGDNTQQSVDSRDWQAMTVAYDEAGRLVDPKLHPELPRLIGNHRPSPVGEMPINDENPVPVVGQDKVAFTDDLGEVWALDARVSANWSGRTPFFIEGDAEWMPESHKVRFVPRGDVLGRPILTFWRGLPWTWFKVGLIY